MKRFLMMSAVIGAMCTPAVAQDFAKNEAALKSLGPSLCETMHLLAAPETAAALPERIDVPVTASDIKKFAGSDVTAGQDMKVSFLKGGKVLVNEQDVTPAISALCTSAGNQKAVIVPDKTTKIETPTTTTTTTTTTGTK